MTNEALTNFQKILEDLELRGLIKIIGNEHVLATKKFKMEFLRAIENKKIFSKAVACYKLILEGYEKATGKRLLEGDRLLLFISILYLILIKDMSLGELNEKEIDIYVENMLGSGVVIGLILGILSDKEHEKFMMLKTHNLPIYVFEGFIKIFKRVDE